MPKIAVYKFITFFIFAYDLLNEPPHLHFYKNKKGYFQMGKIWLESLKFEQTGDFKQHELNLVEKLVTKHQQQLIGIYNKARTGHKNKTLKLKLK